METPAASGFRVYDTRTGGVRDLEPVVPGQVSIYHCGLTVQSAPHVGHIRKEVVFDVLRRWLTHLGLDVTVVANVTDIDDKILAKAAANGEPWWALAYRFERELHTAYDALGCLRPTYEPRATGHVPEMIEMIKTLIERGHAYAAEDGSGRRLLRRAVVARVRRAVAPGRRRHGARRRRRPARQAGLARLRALEGPQGRRARDGLLVDAVGPRPPGWHLECSAMAAKYLGDEFDIHGGGLDLRFPHHENELAQSTAAGQRFARYWMHNGWVTAAGEKMSKSLGNGALVSEVVKAYPPRAVRFYLAAPHYRSAIEFSDTSLAEATAALDRIDTFVQRATALAGRVDPVVPDAFAASMNDDLGTPGAVAVLYTAVRQGNNALPPRTRRPSRSPSPRSAGCSASSGSTSTTPPGRARRRTTGSRAWSTASSPPSWSSAPRPAATATSPPPTRCATCSPTVGVEVADTPQGAEWSLKHATTTSSENV